MLLALLFWSWLWSVAGAIVAVPILAAVKPSLERQVPQPTLLPRLTRVARIEVLEDDAAMAVKVLQAMARAGARLRARPEQPGGGR